MPRESKGARLYTRKRKGRPTVWVIRDGKNEKSTGCSIGERREAEKALQEYIETKWEAELGERDTSRIPISEVLSFYTMDHAPHTNSAALIGYNTSPLIGFWGDKTLDKINTTSCRKYVTRRTSQQSRNGGLISVATARRELETLQAAIGHWHHNSPLKAVPQVTMPKKGEPKTVWLTRNEVAKLLWQVRHQTHIARFLLIGVYTGSRKASILGMKWIPSTNSGWFDLENGVFHRRGLVEVETSKRRPPARIPHKLLIKLKRWHKTDMGIPITNVIHWKGKEVASIKTSWRKAVIRADLGKPVTPHTLRHTAATWLMQSGKAEKWDVAGFLGMSLNILEKVYGHHHPNHQSSIDDAYNHKPAYSGAQSGAVSKLPKRNTL